MAKLSGLISGGKIGQADAAAVAAMPTAKFLDPKAPLAGHGKSSLLDSSAGGIALDSSVVQLEISKIESSPFQVRAVADASYITELAESIQLSGVISPIVVRLLDSSKYEVVAGHHRLAASKKLGFDTVPAVIREMTDAEAARALTSDNAVRKELTDYERYKHAKLLKDRGFCITQSEIGTVLRVSRQLVGFLFAFDAFPKGAIDVLEAMPGLLGADAANGLKDVAKAHPDLFVMAVERLSTGAIKQNQIAAWIESKLGKPKQGGALREVFMINRPGLEKPVRLTVSHDEAKIKVAGINAEKLRQLIEDNIDEIVG